MGLTDQRRELGGAAQPALGLLEVLLTARRIAAQGQDVLDPGVRDPVDDFLQAIGRLTDAAQVRHRLRSILVADRLRGVEGALTRGTACPVGHGEEVRVELAQHLDGLEQGLSSLLRLGGEELDREDRPRRGEHFVDSHPSKGIQRDIESRDWSFTSRSPAASDSARGHSTWTSRACAGTSSIRGSEGGGSPWGTRTSNRGTPGW